MNSMRLKGIHLAMRTGMLAAETAFDAVRTGDTSAARARRRTDERIDASAGARRSCIRCATCTRRSATGCSPALRSPGSSLVTGGWWFKDPMPAHAGYERMQTLAEYYDGRAARSRRRR